MEEKKIRISKICNNKSCAKHGQTLKASEWIVYQDGRARKCKTCGGILKGSKLGTGLVRRKSEVPVWYIERVKPIFQKLMDKSQSAQEEIFYATALARLENLKTAKDLTVWSKDYSKFLQPTLKTQEIKSTGEKVTRIVFGNTDHLEDFTPPDQIDVTPEKEELTSEILEEQPSLVEVE